MRAVDRVLANARVREWATLTAAVLVLAAAFTLAAATMLAVPAPPRVRKAAVEPSSTPVFVPRTDLEIRPLPIPTPLLATSEKVGIHLPVPPKAVTLIAFHQAGSRPPALHLRSLAAVVKPSQITTRPVSKVTTGPDETAEIEAAEERPAESVYDGKVLRLWRSGRAGEPDTAIDVGAKPGTAVLAPVSGTVAAVHRYRLYSQYDDYEIHIVAPGGRVDCCVLHVTDPKVRVGDEVVGGVTRIASVRWLSRWFDSQLDDFTNDGGNHVHVQLGPVQRGGAVQLMGGAQAEFGDLRPATPAPPRPAD